MKKIYNRLKHNPVHNMTNNKVIKSVFMYFLLITFGYVFIYPLVYAVSMSFMSYEDKLNPLVHFIPTAMSLENYLLVMSKINYPSVLIQSVFFAGTCAIAQTISCAIIGYGFAKYKFPLKNLFLVFIMIMFVVPVQLTSIPTYLLLQRLGMLNTPLGLILPALFGQGLKSTIFILIYYQVFSAMPKVIDEAAQIDGAGHFRRFFSISLPLAKPAALLTFLFSFVWYWNETYLSSLYLGQKFTTLPLQLRTFVGTLNANIVKEGPLRMFVTVEMAGVVISIIPLLIMYIFLQKQFTESIDKAGITGE